MKKAVKGLFSLLPRVARERLYKTNNADLGNTIALGQAVGGAGDAPRRRDRQTLAPKTTNILVFQKPS